MSASRCVRQAVGTATRNSHHHTPIARLSGTLIHQRFTSHQLRPMISTPEPTIDQG